MMPIEVELPDGSIVEFPDGTNPRTMEMALAKYRERPSFGDVQTGSSTALNQNDISEWRAQLQKRAFGELSAPHRAVIGMGGRAANLGRGLMQLLPGNNEQEMADEAAARENVKFMAGDTPATLGGIGYDIATMAAPLSKVGQLPRAGQYLTSALAGAGFGASQPVVEGESRGVNTATGFGLGFLGQGASDVVMAVGKRAAVAVKEPARKVYEAAKARGITLTPAQLSDSAFVKRLALMFDNMPGSGATARNEAQQRAVGTNLAAQIGQKSDVVDQSVMGKAYGEMGDEYDALYAGGMRYDREFLKDVAGIRRLTVEQRDNQAQGTINALAKRIKKQGKAGELPGRTLQSLDREARAAATGGGDRQMAATEFRDALRRNMERTAEPGKAPAIRDLNKRYAAYKQLEPLVASSPEGVMPNQIMRAVRTGRNAGRFARGEAGEMGELALIGRRMNPPKSSGTAENLKAASWDNPFNWLVLGPKAAVGATAGRVFNSGLLSDILMRKGRGQGAQLLSPYLRGAGIPATGLLSDQWQYSPDPSHQRP